MRFKITSALVLHRFIKISLRRMFSRSVSGRPLRKPNNFCISPLASERLFKASISLSVKRCLGYLPSNRLRAYALVVSPQRAAYSAISLWSCGVSLTIRRLVYFGASLSINFLFIPSIASIKCATQCELASVQESIGIRTNEVRLYDIGISCIALLSEFTHKHATHWGCTSSQTCCITVFKLPKQQQLWGILRFHLFLEELPSGFCLQFHVRDAWRWNIFLLAIIAIS